MYEEVLSSTLQVLRALPTPTPSYGVLAGFAREYTVCPQEMFRNDNYHFPMGTAFLDLGVSGIADLAAENAARAKTPQSRELLSGISQVYREISRWFDRYAKALDRSTPRLLRMSENLETLAKQPPQTFEQAVQLYYLLWKLRSLCSFTSDLGRLDVHLLPFFQRDMDSGRICEEDARNLICEFWEKLNDNNSGDTLINVMVGGSNADGSDAGSRLSVLMLQASLLTGKTEPHINVRLHKNLNPEIFQAMLQVQRMGQGQGTVYFDETVIPALKQFGVPEELACRYTNDGCTEIMLDGYSGIDFGHIDAVAAFELAMFNGDWAPCPFRSPVKYWHKDCPAIYYTPDAVAGLASGKVEDCATFEEFYQIFLRQYQFQTRNKAVGLRRMRDDRRSGDYSSLLLNGTYDYVLRDGVDIMQGGFPFDAYMLFSGSIPTAADCLAAIRQVVFEQKAYTIGQIKQALAVNFEGYENLRQALLNAPKFGNDCDSVDLLAADIANHFCDWLEAYRQETGFAVMPALLGWRFIEEAHGVSATPDGRRYADPIAEHYCATPGRAQNGPTALLRSIGKAREAIRKAVGVTAVHLTLPNNLGDSEEQALEVLGALNLAAGELGLSEMNIAIYDADLLRQAQKDPEHHRDLIVRVWGYSARFVDLCKEMQDHVIRRIVR